MITAFDRIAYVARQTARVGWYMSHYAAAAGFRDKDARERRQATGRMPSREEVSSDLMDVFRLDLENAARGVYPLPRDHDVGIVELIGRSRRFFADLPAAARRRREGNSREIVVSSDANALPDYFCAKLPLSDRRLPHAGIRRAL